MKNRNNIFSREKIALIGIGFAVMIAFGGYQVYTAYMDSLNQDGYVPTFVSYGTPSAVTIQPIISVHRASGIPLVSAPSVRGSMLFSVAHSSTTNGRIHTTSDATVRTIGSGGVGSEGGHSASHTSHAGRGISYGSASVAMPTLALRSTNTAIASATVTEVAVSSPRIRKIQANGDGSYDGETKTEGGYTYYWDEDAETWVLDMPVGTIKTENGITYSWNGSSWEVVSGSDPEMPVPVGDIPWGVILLTAGLMAQVRRQNTEK